jgi:glutamine amidotransferase
MGWNKVFQIKEHPLWQGIEEGSRFYFVHSYYVDAKQESDIAANTDYICRYTSAAARDNLFATQFHPEKSQHAGLTLLKNFINWDGEN